jgi:hypothetical protein
MTPREASLIDSLLTQRPKFHGYRGVPMDWGIKRPVVEFIANNVDQSDASLETGCGISTIVFAVKRSRHTTVTPSQGEIDAVSRYAAEHSLPLDTVNFVNDRSEHYLPKATLEPLDFVFIDGRHAFPWPALDYFYTSPIMKPGALLVVDDVAIPTVKMLTDFLDADENWEIVKRLPRTSAYRKVGGNLDVEWDLQGYNADYQRRTFLRKATGKAMRVVRRGD